MGEIYFQKGPSKNQGFVIINQLSSRKKETASHKDWNYMKVIAAIKKRILLAIIQQVEPQNS
ncbi:hypothetical protein DWU89_14105 [Parabacteroides acidifaciens]|uniref:Uncharacterized protein n=1 Tax=Parabacteroides acidifaciens TaxID=2290935 RepID=A0A3D8HBW2_9BACT|nr:hypothetical protein DWU89_14105 [Parabacteroides acidifaciens]